MAIRESHRRHTEDARFGEWAFSWPFLFEHHTGWVWQERDLRLQEGARALVADKLSDAANLAAGAMVFGQFLSERPFSLGLMIVGAGIWLGFVWCSVVLVERKG